MERVLNVAILARISPVYKAGVEEEDSHSFVTYDRIHKQLNYEGYGKLKSSWIFLDSLLY